MKTPQPKSVLDQLRLQVQLDRHLADLGNELQALPELGAAMARVGATTTMVPEEGTPDLETGSEDSGKVQRFEAFPLAKQAGVLRDALLGALPGFELGSREDNPVEDGQKNEISPILMSRLAQGVASLERTVYSTGLLCQVTGALLRVLDKDGAEETHSLSVSFFHSASRLQHVIDFLDQVNAQNPLADLPPSDYERYIRYLKEAQEKLDEFEGPDLPKQPQYTPVFFAKRHNRTETNVRQQLEAWSTRRNNLGLIKKKSRWVISDYETARQFDKWLYTVRREKASESM